MTVVTIIAGVTSIALLGFLFYALLHSDRG